MKTFTSHTAAAVAAILVTAASVVAVSPAQAQSREVRVSYKDLNLASAAGVETLKTRIRSAARTVCRDTDQLGTRIQGRCYRGAVDGAMAKLPVPTQVASR